MKARFYSSLHFDLKKRQGLNKDYKIIWTQMRKFQDKQSNIKLLHFKGWKSFVRGKYWKKPKKLIILFHVIYTLQWLRKEFT